MFRGQRQEILSHIPRRKRGRCGAIILCCLVLVAVLGAGGCRQGDFPNYPANYREYAYISNGGSNTVTVLDVVNMRQDRVIRVGAAPSGLAVNPRRNEVYVVNSGSNTVTVINAESNTVAATMRVQRRPYFIDVDAQGERAYVANSNPTMFRFWIWRVAARLASLAPVRGPVWLA